MAKGGPMDGYDWAMVVTVAVTILASLVLFGRRD
jgi:hypothetical protein